MQPDKSKTSVRMPNLPGIQVRPSIRLLLTRCVLLVMAGVEQNPGPPKKLTSTSSASQSSQSRTEISDDGGLGLAGSGMINEDAGQTFNPSRTLHSIQGELKSLNRNYMDVNTKVDNLFNKLNTNYEQLRLSIS